MTIEPTQKRAVIYARFSPRPDAMESNSLEYQVSFCKKYCETYDMRVIAVESDAAMSGGNTERPGLHRAIEIALKHRAVMVVYSISRLARNIKDTIELSEMFKKKGVELASVKEKFDTSDASGRLYFNIMAALAEFERDQIRERTRDAMLRYQANGRRMSKRIPYGFMQDPTDSSRIIENLYEQKVLHRIIELHEMGLGPYQIARTLDEEGYASRPRKIIRADGKTGTERKPWHHATISTILKKCRTEYTPVRPLPEQRSQTLEPEPISLSTAAEATAGGS